MELARTCIGTPYYLSPEICENRPYNNKRFVMTSVIHCMKDLPDIIHASKIHGQRGNKAISGSLGLVEFAVLPVDSDLHLPRKVK